jgi:hypothetical protein
VDVGKKISGQLVVAGGDRAKMLEFAEEALDQIALAIEGKIAGQRRRHENHSPNRFKPGKYPCLMGSCRWLNFIQGC